VREAGGREGGREGGRGSLESRQIQKITNSTLSEEERKERFRTLLRAEKLKQKQKERKRRHGDIDDEDLEDLEDQGEEDEGEEEPDPRDMEADLEESLTQFANTLNADLLSENQALQSTRGLMEGFISDEKFDSMPDPFAKAPTSAGTTP
jgi:hypothetical protein